MWLARMWCLPWIIDSRKGKVQVFVCGCYRLYLLNHSTGTCLLNVKGFTITLSTSVVFLQHSFCNNRANIGPRILLKIDLMMMQVCQIRKLGTIRYFTKWCKCICNTLNCFGESVDHWCIFFIFLFFCYLTKDYSFLLNNMSTINIPTKSTAAVWSSGILCILNFRKPVATSV